MQKQSGRGKGRHALKTLCNNDESVKQKVDEALAQFRSSMESSPNDRASILGCCASDELFAIHARVVSLGLKLRAPLQHEETSALLAKNLQACMPDAWLADEFQVPRAARNSLSDEDRAGVAELETLELAGMKQDHVYAGLDGHGLPSIKLQITGGRMLICADVIDACIFYQTKALAEVRDALASVEMHSVPDAMAFPSLRAIFVKSGDILFVPGGMLVVEKNINELGMSIRSGACLDFRIIDAQIISPV